MNLLLSLPFTPLMNAETSMTKCDLWGKDSWNHHFIFSVIRSHGWQLYRTLLLYRPGESPQDCPIHMLSFYLQNQPRENQKICITSYSSCFLICHFLESMKQILLSGVWWPTHFLNEIFFKKNEKERKKKTQTNFRWWVWPLLVWDQKKKLNFFYLKFNKNHVSIIFVTVSK